MPGLVFVVYLGSCSEDIAAMINGTHQGSDMDIAISIVSTIAGLLSVIALGCFTKKKLNELIDREAHDQGGDQATMSCHRGHI